MNADAQAALVLSGMIAFFSELLALAFDASWLQAGLISLVIVLVLLFIAVLWDALMQSIMNEKR